MLLSVVKKLLISLNFVNMKKYIGLSLALLLVPALAFAVEINGNGIGGIVLGIKDIINIVMPLIIIIAVVIVIWGAVQIILGAGSEESRASGRSKILWGLIGVFLALAAWALVSIVVNAVTFTGDDRVLDPTYRPMFPGA